MVLAELAKPVAVPVPDEEAEEYIYDGEENHWPHKLPWHERVYWLC